MTEIEAGGRRASASSPIGCEGDGAVAPGADAAIGLAGAHPTAPGTLDAQAYRRRWELVLPHREQMLAIARRRVATREDAEDVVATALVRTVEHPRLDEARIGAFLCTTVMRLAVDVHRDRDRQLAVGMREATQALPGESVEELLCDEAEARWLAEQLQDLPQRERQVLQARLSGMTAQQASVHLGLTAKATENAFTRVRQRAHGLLAATLAGLGILFGAGRRLTKPEVALIPAAATTALVLAVVVASKPPAASPPEVPVVLDADVESASVAPTPVAPAADSAPATMAPTPASAGRQSGVASASSPTPSAVPSSTRTELTAPPVVDKDVVDPGGVYFEKRHTDETFEQSLQRCLNNVDVNDPLADPCR
jgi:RNA polymerase sigma factor (sigma-70 family)